MQTCLRCKEEKPLTEFQRESTRKSGYRGRCKSCEAETRKVPSTSYDTPQKAWRRHIKAKFGITEDVYHELYANQNGRCAICGTEDPSSKHGFFSIDHCHTTGKIRGLLCQHCNKGLGMFRESAKSLQEAVAYLQQNG